MPTDKFAVRLVIATFAVIALVSLVAMIGLAYSHHAVPRAIDGAFTFTTGALVGVIAKTTTTEEAAPPYKLTSGSDAVTVAEAPTVVVPPTD